MTGPSPRENVSVAALAALFKAVSKSSILKTDVSGIWELTPAPGPPTPKTFAPCARAPIKMRTTDEPLAMDTFVIPFVEGLRTRAIKSMLTESLPEVPEKLEALAGMAPRF